MSLVDDAVVIDDALGEGGQGTIYLMKSNKGELFILKRRAEGADKARFLAAYEAHKRMAGHEAFQRAYEGDEDILALEYVAGPTLAHYEGMLSWAGAVPVLRSLCEAVQAMESEGLIHRDIKPSNLVLSDGRLVVIDLGSIEVGWGITHGEAGEVPHTPGFASPELSAGAPITQLENSFQIAGVARFLLGDFRQVPDGARAVLERCFETPLSRPRVSELLHALSQTHQHRRASQPLKTAVLAVGVLGVSIASTVVLWKANEKHVETRVELDRVRKELASARAAQLEPPRPRADRNIEAAESASAILPSITLSEPATGTRPVDESSKKPTKTAMPMSRERQRELRIKAHQEALRARQSD